MGYDGARKTSYLLREVNFLWTWGWGSFALEFHDDTKVDNVEHLKGSILVHCAHHVSNPLSCAQGLFVPCQLPFLLGLYFKPYLVTWFRYNPNSRLFSEVHQATDQSQECLDDWLWFGVSCAISASKHLTEYCWCIARVNRPDRDVSVRVLDLGDEGKERCVV